MSDEERTINCPHCGRAVPIPVEEVEKAAGLTPDEPAPDAAGPEDKPEAPAETAYTVEPPDD